MFSRLLAACTVSTYQYIKKINMKNRSMILPEQDSTMLSFKSKQELMIFQKKVYMQVSQHKKRPHSDGVYRSGA
jgi:hypothetical protein